MDNAEIIAAARQYVNEKLPEQALDYTNGKVGASEYQQKLYSQMEYFQTMLDMNGNIGDPDYDYVLAAGCRQAISAAASELTRIWKRR